MFVLNSVSVTCAFVASLMCQSNIIFLRGVSIFLFKKRGGGAGGIVPVFSVVLISPLFIQFLWGFFSSLKCFIVHGIFISVILTIVIHNPQKPIFKAEAKK